MKKEQNRGRLWATLLFFIVQLLGLLLTFDVLMLRLSFLKQEVKRYEPELQIECGREEVLEATSAMMHYINGAKTDLSQVRVVKDGRYVPFFTERDLEHLKEVRKLVTDLRLLLGGLAIAAVLLWLFVRKKRAVSAKDLRAGYGISVAVLAFLCVGIGILMARYPLHVINGFHELFFRSDTWVLNPATDYLVLLFPKEVFRDGLILWIFGIAGWQILLFGACVSRKKL